MTSSPISRRQFVAGVASAGAMIATRSALGRPIGANDRVRVGFIGPGDRGRELLREFLSQANKMNMEMAAVCDLWYRPREIAVSMVEKAGQKKPLLCRNTEELYEIKDLDAVIIATPDFSHALHCAEAVKHGLDVYVEKPLADVLEDARICREAVKASDRVVQVGTQRRSEGVYIGAAEFIQSGQFGKVIKVEMNWNVNQSKRWRREGDCRALAQDIQNGKFDPADAWKRYRLNRPDDEFHVRKYLEFRLFWPYSCGLPDQWMSHQIDTVAWLTGDPYPKSAVAGGGLYQWKDGRRNPDTFTTVLEYPSGFQVCWTGRQNNSSGGTKEVYLSNWGTLDLDKGTISGEGGGDQNKSPGSKKLQDKPIPKGKGMGHMLNWMECIRTRKQPNANIDAAYSHAVAVAMAVRALHTGKRITFDPQTHEIREGGEPTYSFSAESL
jgi:predicted dehydrogenase